MKKRYWALIVLAIGAATVIVMNVPKDSSRLPANSQETNPTSTDASAPNP